MVTLSSIIQAATIARFRRERLWRRAGVPGIILVLVMLALAACVPLIQAPGDGERAATAISTPAMAAALIRVEAMVEALHQAGLFNGVALIAQDGKILWSKGWGMADRQQAIPNTPQTIFRIYQTTTQFTAAALLLLEQEDKLKMTDPICAYLDDCPAAWQPITIHHLLTHTSGLVNYLDIAEQETDKFTRQGATPAQLVALFRDHPLTFQPGAQRAWSQSGFVLAGLIIERVSGQPYGDFVEQHLFAPVGMTQSGYGTPDEGLALGYLTAQSTTPVQVDISAFYASGGLYSTAEDLFRWNEALYNGQLLDETQVQKMITAHAITEFKDGAGYGLVLGEDYGHTWAGNGGRFDGYAVRVRRYLDDQITLVLISNHDMEIAVLGDQVVRAFFVAP